MYKNYTKKSKPDDGDILLMMVAKSHFGASHVTESMQKYDSGSIIGSHRVIDVNEMWNGIVKAAAAITSIKDPSEVVIFGTSRVCKHGVEQFGYLTNITSITDNYRRIERFKISLMIVVNSVKNARLFEECAKKNIPVISFLNLNSDTDNVDIKIPCNNRTALSMSRMLWLLAREVLRMRGDIVQSHSWRLDVESFYHINPAYMEIEDYQR